MEKIIIARQLEEFLVCLRNAIETGFGIFQNDGIYHIYPHYLADFKNNKIMLDNGDWVVNFTSTHGMYFYLLEDLIRLCIEEKDPKERLDEVSKIEIQLHELAGKARKLEVPKVAD